MRRNLFVLAVSMILPFSCVDTASLEAEIDELKTMLENINARCDEINSELSALDGLVSALNSRDYVTSIQPFNKDGKLEGYIISFADSPTVTIRLSGNDEDHVKAPVISVRQDEDGAYHWVCNGEYVLDGEGNRVPVGTSGTVPELKVESSVWYVSYDDGKTWNELWKVDLDTAGSSLFGNVNLTDPSKVVLTLTDNTQFTFPTAYDGLVTLSLVNPGVDYRPGDVVEVRYSALKNVTVSVDDTDVQASEVVAEDNMNGIIRISTSTVALSKQRAFLIFSIEGLSAADWRMLSFGASGKAVISDIK